MRHILASIGSMVIAAPAEIRGPRVTLQPVSSLHAPALRLIRHTREVFRWWGPVHPDFPFDEDEPGYAVIMDWRVIGFAQHSEENEPMYRHAGIDLFLDPDVHGLGLGRETVAALAAHLIDVRGHHRLVIDPCTENDAAIACYRAVGFQPVGVMRRYERSPDGPWRDGLLMDLLAEDLRRDLLG
jgi:aminoglycoside 6'-N-acetyltransferase